VSTFLCLSSFCLFGFLRPEIVKLDSKHVESSENFDSAARALFIELGCRLEDLFLAAFVPFCSGNTSIRSPQT
jgi:hypothetical protein